MIVRLLAPVVAFHLRHVNVAPRDVPEDLGVSQELWTEQDESDRNASLVLVKNGDAVSGGVFPIAFPHPRTPDQITVQILGLYNTGTNLLQALLDKNFPGVFVPPAPGRKAFGQIFWKHVQPTVLMRKAPNLKHQLEVHDAVALAMIRDPLAWLQSTKTAPYDLVNCVHRPGWITAPCTLPLHTSTGGGAAHTMPGPQTLPSLPAFWNEWTDDYGHLQDFGFRRSLVISYEELVLDTEGVLDKIAHLVGVAPPATVQHKHRPAKPLGGGRAAAIAKLSGKTWLTGYAPGELKAACARLSPELMQKYGFGGDCP